MYYIPRNATHNRSRRTWDTVLYEQLSFHTAIVVNFDHGLARKMLADTFEKRPLPFHPILFAMLMCAVVIIRAAVLLVLLGYDTQDIQIR
jgi:hypothetical protein